MEYIREHRNDPVAGPQYLIHWHGFQEKDESWEPAENFTDPLLLRTYWELQPSRNRKAFEVRCSDGVRGHTVSNIRA